MSKKRFPSFGNSKEWGEKLGVRLGEKIVEWIKAKDERLKNLEKFIAWASDTKQRLIDIRIRVLLAYAFLVKSSYDLFFDNSFFYREYCYLALRLWNKKIFFFGVSMILLNVRMFVISNSEESLPMSNYKFVSFYIIILSIQFYYLFSDVRNLFEDRDYEYLAEELYGKREEFLVTFSFVDGDAGKISELVVSAKGIKTDSYADIEEVIFNSNFPDYVIKHAEDNMGNYSLDKVRVLHYFSGEEYILMRNGKSVYPILKKLEKSA